ncbi:MAG: Pyrophosphate--fructose 6-phosphate 1-phosphotransferase [Planctomycetes bacterium ADurb.Bin401]|nr:MAG: Pyrophosphate--fructose 6-phosphate 1-phosphotransferase [Planctomycetes bacterium ADurb.Bin401]
MLKGNAIIGQSGGPTAVINSSLAGIITKAKECSCIKNILGMRYGIEGFMSENIINLGSEPNETIQKLKITPSSSLGSCRHKLKDADLPKILELLKKYDIRYIFLIGGNDTMDTIHRIEEYAKQNNYEMIGIGVPKTVDNDLFGTDHTPGFPSAARYIALSVLQAGILARDMQKVDQFVIFQCIGRKAGWLPAAATLAKKDPSDAPHILCLPERPFEKEKFLNQVKRCYKDCGFVSIVCGEGLAFEDGTPVSASQVKDKFDNIEFGAMGGTSVAVALHSMISASFGFRGEFQITESLPMCAADRAVLQDIEEAFETGKAAVELAMQEKTGLMVTLNRKPGNKYEFYTGSIGLKEVAIKAKPMPDEFISGDGFSVTQAFLDYAKPLVGPLSEYANLKYKKFN